MEDENLDMAGDWIKVNRSVGRSPQIVRIASALKADICFAIGGVVSVWWLFDEQTEDGILVGYSADMLDKIVQCPGITTAMASVGWMIIDKDDSIETLIIPEFEKHMGKSARRRMQDSQRKKNVRKMSASQADKNETREEKRREEDNNPKPLKKGAVDLSKLSKAELRKTYCSENSAIMNRINVWFGSTDRRRWTEYESGLLHDLNPSDDDFDLMERFYKARGERKKGEADLWKHDIATLLNQWTEQMDRARLWDKSQDKPSDVWGDLENQNSYK